MAKVFFRNLKLRRRLAFTMAAVVLIILGTIFQQQVLQVAAHVQGLLVSRTAIYFGTVFPEEKLSDTYFVQLDKSSQSATYTTSLQQVKGKMDLCPHLELKNIDVPAEADTVNLAALTAPSDKLDRWQVLFTVPAIKGEVAQDDTGKIVVSYGYYACKIVIVMKKSTSFGGCSAGYWNQPKHFKNWVGYTTGQQFFSVFENAFPGKSLLQVLNLTGGGMLNAMGRQTVAALLNAANPDVRFGYTTSEVISAFNAVYPGTNADYETLKNLLEKANIKGCPLK